MPRLPLPRPLRRILADWLSRIIERLLHLQDQLRYGLIRMISSSVAETIEDHLHRPFGPPHNSYEEDYLDYESTSVRRLAYAPEPSPMSLREHWQTLWAQATDWLRPWLQMPWLETAVAGSVTLLSLFFLVG